MNFFRRFRETVIVWLDRQLRADLYVRPAGRTGAGQFPALSVEAPKLVAAVDGVEAVDIFHALEFRYQGQRATLGAGQTDIMRRYGRLRFMGSDRDAILQWTKVLNDATQHLAEIMMNRSVQAALTGKSIDQM